MLVFRILNQRILELEAQLEDLRESTAGSAPSEEVANLRRNLATVSSKVGSLESDLRRRATHEEELEGRVGSQAQQLTALQDTLTRKDEEMRAMEERYKRYLEKCKSVSSSTPCHHTTHSPPVYPLCYVPLCRHPSYEPNVCDECHSYLVYHRVSECGYAQPHSYTSPEPEQIPSQPTCHIGPTGLVNPENEVKPSSKVKPRSRVEPQTRSEVKPIGAATPQVYIKDQNPIKLGNGSELHSGTGPQRQILHLTPNNSTRVIESYVCRESPSHMEPQSPLKSTRDVQSQIQENSQIQTLSERPTEPNTDVEMTYFFEPESPKIPKRSYRDSETQTNVEIEHSIIPVRNIKPQLNTHPNGNPQSGVDTENPISRRKKGKPQNNVTFNNKNHKPESSIEPLTPVKMSLSDKAPQRQVKLRIHTDPCRRTDPNVEPQDNVTFNKKHKPESSIEPLKPVKMSPSDKASQPQVELRVHTDPCRRTDPRSRKEICSHVESTSRKEARSRSEPRRRSEPPKQITVPGNDQPVRAPSPNFEIPRKKKNTLLTDLLRAYFSSSS